MKGIIEPFVITQDDPAGDITQTDSTASVMSDWMVYRVPRNRKIILRPGDVFAAFIDDTGSTELLDPVKIKIEIRDAAGAGEKRPVTGEIPYSQIKEFRDEDKMFRLPIAGPIEVSQYEYIAIMGNDSTGLDKDLSWFSLVCRSMR